MHRAVPKQRHCGKHFCQKYSNLFFPLCYLRCQLSAHIHCPARWSVVNRGIIFTVKPSWSWLIGARRPTITIILTTVMSLTVSSNFRIYRTIRVISGKSTIVCTGIFATYECSVITESQKVAPVDPHKKSNSKRLFFVSIPRFGVTLFLWCLASTRGIPCI
jgi:hypothetical protein